MTYLECLADISLKLISFSLESEGCPSKSLFQMNLFTFLISNLTHLSINCLLSAWLVQESRGKKKYHLRRGLLSYAQSIERKSLIGGGLVYAEKWKELLA